MLPKTASKIIAINSRPSMDPDPRPSNTSRPHLVKTTEDGAETRRFLEPTRRDLYTAFLAGTSEFKLTERMGGRSQGVCRIDIEAAIRESAREDRQARLEAERQLRLVRRYAA